MTGAYVRVERDGKWESLEVEYLTNDERTERFADSNVDEVVMWLDCVCKSLVEAEALLEHLEDDGMLELMEMKGEY